MKLYILVRKDLSPGQQTVQACHAVAEFMLSHSGDPQVLDWANNHKTMVVLGTDDIDDWCLSLSNQNIAHAAFAEPDMGDIVTAIAVHPSTDRRLFRHLKLVGA